MTALPTIAAIRATPVSVPLAHPLRTASGTITNAPLVLIDLSTNHGVLGRSYVFTYTALALKPVVQLIDNMAELILNAPLAPADIERSIDARFRLLGHTGLVTIASAAIDMALWDALARGAELPLARLLGGTVRPIPAYFSQGLDGVERGAALAHEALARGFKLMKIKVGFPTLEEDLRVIHAVQSVLGTSAKLAVDFNQSLQQAEALRRCHALDELGLAWIEEPLRQDDYAGHAKIARAIRTPVQIGENWYGIHEMAKALSAQASDLVMPDLMKIGGVSGWLRAASLAHAAGLPMSSHLFQEVSAHCMTVTPSAHWLEYLNIADPILATPLRIEDGMAVFDDAPGSGIDWNPEAIAKFQVR